MLELQNKHMDKTKEENDNERGQNNLFQFFFIKIDCLLKYYTSVMSRSLVDLVLNKMVQGFIVILYVSRAVKTGI